MILIYSFRFNKSKEEINYFFKGKKKNPTHAFSFYYFFFPDKIYSKRQIHKYTQNIKTNDEEQMKWHLKDADISLNNVQNKKQRAC